MKSVAVLVLAAALPALAADGPALFRRSCAPCHGFNGDANNPAGKSLGAKDLGSEPVQKLTDAEIGTIISHGKGKMPRFDRLGTDEVKALIAVVRGFRK